MKLVKKILSTVALTGLFIFPSTVHAGQLNNISDLNNQLSIIADSRYDWEFTDDYASWEGYVITDLDMNGRIEIIRNILAGSGLFSTNDLWEVNSSRTGLIHVSDSSEFDIGASNQIAAYYNPYTDCYYYMAEDTGRSGIMYSYWAKGSLSYKNGSLTSRTLAQYEADHQKGIETYTDEYRNRISKNTFENIGDIVYGNYDKCLVNMKWIQGSLPYDNLYQLLSESANSFDVKKTHIPGWFLENGVWRFYDANGMMATGWRLINNNWYYFNGNGTMLTNWQNINGIWYYFDLSGAMLTGWQYINNIWYYFDGSGAMLTNWQVISGNWYYFNYSGAMLTGWQDIYGTWYYFSPSGAMLTGWQGINNTWYYFNYSGAMLTGWQNINNSWYYFNYSGAMLTGWQDIYGTWYYFYPNGAMASNTWIGNCYVNSSGAWV